MKLPIFALVRNTLKNDATLQGYLGGAYVYRRHPAQAPKVPSITLDENTEKSKPRVGYITHKTRDLAPTLQVDVWVASSGEDLDRVAYRVDELLLPGVTGTRAWERISSSDQYDEDLKAFHKALRYSFEYSVTDNT